MTVEGRRRQRARLSSSSRQRRPPPSPPAYHGSRPPALRCHHCRMWAARVNSSSVSDSIRLRLGHTDTDSRRLLLRALSARSPTLAKRSSTSMKMSTTEQTTRLFLLQSSSNGPACARLLSARTTLLSSPTRSGDTPTSRGRSPPTHQHPTLHSPPSTPPCLLA